MSSAKILIHFKYITARNLKLLNWYLRILHRYDLISQANKAQISAVVPINFEFEFNSDLATIFSYQEYKSPSDSYEEATLNLIPSLIKQDAPAHIGYIHLKGSSHPKFSLNSMHWAIAMIRNLSSFLPLLNSNLLDNYDSIGSFLSYSSMGQKLKSMLPHYPGNFWIAKSDYLNHLDYSILTPNERYSAEYFLGSSMGNMYNIDAYPARMYHFKLRLNNRKLIPYISDALQSNQRINLPKSIKPFYLGSEFKISQPGFPQFIASPSWLKYVNFGR